MIKELKPGIHSPIILGNYEKKKHIHSLSESNLNIFVILKDYRKYYERNSGNKNFMNFLLFVTEKFPMSSDGYILCSSQ